MPIDLGEIKKIPFLKGCSEEIFKQVGACLNRKSFDKGQVLFSEGHGCERIFIVRAGQVKLYRMNSSGREQVLEVLKAGDTCACNPGITPWSCMSTAEAMTPCEVFFLSRIDYLRLIETHPDLSHSLNRLLADRLRCFSSLIEEVSLKDTKKRLVRFLLDMYEARPAKGSDVIEFPFSREEVARRIGAARETVARNLSELKRARLIDLKLHQIIILDKGGLQKLVS